MVSPIQAEQRGQAGDHPAWGAESWQAELDHEEGAAHGGTTVLQEQRGDAQSSIPGSTRSLGIASRQTLCPPKRTRTGECPSAGRAGMRMILLVMCSPAPCLWCCHWEGRSRAGRELQPHSCCTPSERAARQGKAGQAVTRTSFGFSTVNPGSHLVALTLSQGGQAWSSRQGEGRELLTPLTCAACGFARPQDLAHCTCGSNTSVCLTLQSPKQ